MAFWGFGKKKPISEQQAAEPAPPAGIHEDTSSDFELPEVPPLEDLDLPPPPSYPKAAQPKPEPVPPVQPERDMFVSDKPFFMTPKTQFPEPKTELPTLFTRPEPKPEPKPEPRLPELRRTVETPPRQQIIREVEHRPPPQGPLYVRVDSYTGVIEGTDHVRNNLKEVGDIVVRMNELKNEEDKEFEKWRAELEDIQRKLTYVDKIIFESS